MTMLSLVLPAAILASTSPGPPSDWVIPAGQTVVYDTSFPQSGSVTVRDLVIETGATLRVVGVNPFRVRASGRVHLDGHLDLSGASNPGVANLDTTNIQDPGRKGGPGGGSGGTGNPLNYASCQAGSDGLDGVTSLLGGRGGESGFNPSGNDVFRRPGGGGGGRLGSDLRLVHVDIFHPSNAGRVARDGLPGAVQASSAVQVGQRPMGGSVGASPFVDADPENDYFGRRIDDQQTMIIVGELARPLGGRGGGGGGNAIASSSFPTVWTPGGDEKGAGGGGGGGLCILIAAVVEMGPLGKISCNGGAGGAGEDSSAGGIIRIGGGSGGGSGGMLLVQSRLIDLSTASPSCIRALGGRGGPGANNVVGGDCGGGDGGPGIVQFHLQGGLSDVLLPQGQTLRSMTVPEALVLLPEPNL